MKNPDYTSSLIPESNLDNYLDTFPDTIELFPAGLFVLNQDALIIDVNKPGLLLICNDKKEILNKNFSEFIEEKDKEKFRLILKKVFKISETQTIEIKVKGINNSYFPALAMIRCVETPVTTNRFCFLALIDITAQKIKEELIKDSEARFENIANTAPVMIWIADVEGLFSFVNQVWCDYSGKEIGDHLGMNWLKDVHQEDQEKLLSNYRNAFRSRESFSFEFRLKRKDGKYEWMIIKGTPRFNSENIFMGFIGSCTNINAQKEFEDKIKKVNDELVEINTAKDKFFSIISHDLRSPLGGLVSLLGIISDENLDEEEKQKLINEASLASKQAYALMENLLEWSLVQIGRIPFNPEKTEILPLISKYKPLYNQSLKIKKISLETDTAPGLFVFADVRMTQTILRNLISNAIKFTKSGGTVSVIAESNTGYVTIKVIDTGVGMDEKDIDKLFRANISHTTKGTAKESGTGLGLMLCKELVEKQGGKIWVESKKDQGSTFYFTLPAG